MAAGMAKGFAKRGRRVAFGDGDKIIWDHNSEAIFKNNPNIAKPGTERQPGTTWINFYRGHRLYNTQSGDRWVWNYDFKAKPGEIFLDTQELNWGKRQGSGYIVIEPNVPTYKTVAPNKQWSKEKYQWLAKTLRGEGHRVVQFCHTGCSMDGVEQIKTPSFRHALAALKNAKLYIGPEGGLHHGAAAVGIPAVVIFGGFIPPKVTGYDSHINLTGGAIACGSIRPCEHCRQAMIAIRGREVYDAAKSLLEKVAA